MTEKRDPGYEKIYGKVRDVLMKYGVAPVEIEECMEWAFGRGAWYVPPYPDWMVRWRVLHPGFTIKKTDKFYEWIAVVGHLFLEQKKLKVRAGFIGRNLN